MPSKHWNTKTDILSFLSQIAVGKQWYGKWLPPPGKNVVVVQWSQTQVLFTQLSFCVVRWLHNQPGYICRASKTKTLSHPFASHPATAPLSVVHRATKSPSRWRSGMSGGSDAAASPRRPQFRWNVANLFLNVTKVLFDVNRVSERLSGRKDLCVTHGL